MVLEIPLLDADATCATCYINKHNEYDTSYREPDSEAPFEEDATAGVKWAEELLRDRLLSPHLRLSWSNMWLSLSNECFASAVWAQFFNQRVFSSQRRQMMDSHSLTWPLAMQHDEMDYDIEPVLWNIQAGEMLAQSNLADRISNYAITDIGSEGRPDLRYLQLLQSSSAWIGQYPTDISYRKRRYWSNVELSAETEQFLARHSTLEHMVRVALRTVEDEIYLKRDDFALRIELTQDPECESPDLQLLMEARNVDYDQALELWEKLSAKVENEILQSALRNKLSQDETDAILDMFTIAVEPARSER